MAKRKRNPNLVTLGIVALAGWWAYDKYLKPKPVDPGATLAAPGNPFTDPFDAGQSAVYS